MERDYEPVSIDAFVESLAWAGKWMRPLKATSIYPLYLDYAMKANPHAMILAPLAFAHRIKRCPLVKAVPVRRNRPDAWIPKLRYIEAAEAMFAI